MFRKSFQLGLLHLAVAMTLVPINSTLNRVMVKELGISATLVAVMASLPYLVSPIQVVIGSFSDRHPVFGFHRTPYILVGILLCVVGVMLSPQIAFTLAVDFWKGLGVGVLAFGAWGMGYNLAAVSYLSLASEIAGKKERGRTIAIMWVMMIIGIIVTALILSRLVDPYSEAALQRAFVIIGVAAMVLGVAGLIRLESRSSKRASLEQERYTWAEMLETILKSAQVKTFFGYLFILLTALLGQDILLEPYAAEAFDLSVRQTTQITSIWGTFVMLALLLTGWLETKIAKKKLAGWGGWLALAGFVLIAISGLWLKMWLFYLGIFLLGTGTGVSTVSNLSLMLDMTIESKVGLFIGAWGMANAYSRLVGSVLGGAGRDLVSQASGNPVLGYVLVFGMMAAFMVVSLVLLRRINVQEFQRDVGYTQALERVALSSDL